MNSGRAAKSLVEIAASMVFAITARIRSWSLPLATKLASDGDAYEGVAAPVPPGRWTLVIEASRGAERLFRSENKLAVADTTTTN